MRRLLTWDDIPTEIRYPANWDQWEAIAIRRGKECERTVVRSDSKADAETKGKMALRMTCVRGRYSVKVRPYYPWFDRALAGCVQYVR
jgi:hypothetical protein